MAASDAEDSLPPNWRVEVRVRKNGRKEKVLFERVEAEGLPDGWKKEVKVTKSANKVRRDPFYTDPVSGYIFRSLKDVNRYLETGELGRLAYKPKDKGSHDEQDSEIENDHSPTAAKKQKIATTGTEQFATGQSTKLDEIPKDDDVATERENTPLCEPSSNQGEAGTELSSPDLPEAKGSSKVDEGKNSEKSECLSTPAAGAVPEKQTLESVAEAKQTLESAGEAEMKKSKPGKGKSNKKKVHNMPRRSSKRLAGIELEPTPELKTTSRARRAMVKQSVDEVYSTVEGSKSTDDLQESTKSKHPSGDLANRTENGIEIEMKGDSSKKKGVADDLPLEDQAKVETGGEAHGKLNPSPTLDLPFDDLLSDPCIAFAIKTLTGENFETSSCMEASLGSHNSNSVGIATAEENAGKESYGDQKQNLATPGEDAVNVKSASKTDDKPGLPLDSPFADILTDPCIEFAIKTLTGTIPVGFDVDTPNYLEQQLNSSQTQSNNNFCQTEFLSQQYNVLEKPVTREQTRPRTRSLSVKNSGAAGIRQPGENRFNECH